MKTKNTLKIKHSLQIFLLLIPLISSLTMYASDSQTRQDKRYAVEEVYDFQTLSQNMQRDNKSLLLMLHMEECPYCEQMEEEMLSPMLKSGEYDTKTFIKKLQIDGGRVITDFDGKRVFPADIADRYDSQLTPTLVFLDARGKERTEPIIGVYTMDFLGAYIDKALEEAQTAISRDQ